MSVCKHENTTTEGVTITGNRRVICDDCGCLLYHERTEDDADAVLADADEDRWGAER